MQHKPDRDVLWGGCPACGFIGDRHYLFVHHSAVRTPPPNSDAITQLSTLVAAQAEQIKRLTTQLQRVSSPHTDGPEGVE